MAAHELVKYWREKRGLSQAELGDRSGLVQSKICRIERGELRLTADDLAEIVKGLELTMARFYAARAA